MLLLPRTAYERIPSFPLFLSPPAFSPAILLFPHSLLAAMARRPTQRHSDRHPSQPMSIVRKVTQRVRWRRSGHSETSAVPNDCATTVALLSATAWPSSARVPQHSLKPIACRPLTAWTPSSPSHRHTLSVFNSICPSCSALHWIEERVVGTSIVHPQYSACCGRGNILLHQMFNPPEPLYSLLTSTPGGPTFTLLMFPTVCVY